MAGTGESGGGGDGGPATEAQLAYPTGLAVDSDDCLHIADADNGRIRRIDRSGTITTIAGIGDGHFGGDGGPAVGARLDEPTGLAVDSEANLYIADTANHRVRRIDRSGTISTVAGTGVGAYGGDGGQATEAQLHAPSDVALDSTGNVYIADTWNNRVRRIDPAGMISTVAGNGESSLQGDKGDGGPAPQARMDEPISVALDSSGNLLIIESGTSSVRLVDPSGTISTVAGRGDRGYSGDGGPATASALGSPRGIAADSSGNIYIADAGNHRVRRVAPSGTISTVAGTGDGGYSGDGGLATEARLRYPTGVAVDSSGTLYVADMGNFRVRRIDVSGRISTAAYYHRGGTSEFSALFRSSGVAVDSAGRLYVSEVWNHRVHRIDTSGNLSRVVGVAAVERGGDGGPAVKAELYQPHGLAFDQAGNLYVAESGNHRVRRIDPSGIISTVGGTGANGHGWDGLPALEPALSSPSGVAVDMSGNLFVADGSNHRVIRIDPSGIVSTVAGNGMVGYDGDGGPADRYSLNRPSGVAVDSSGNLYVADSRNNRIRKIDPSGTILTVAGGRRGELGDGGPADRAALRRPSDVAVDSSGNLFIADTGNGVVRRVNPLGIISTVRVAGYDGGADGTLLQDAFRGPSAVAVDASGNLYFADDSKPHIWRIDPSGIVAKVAGTGLSGYSGDGGPATKAKIGRPEGLAVDPSGSLYFSDTLFHVVRRIDSSGTIATVAGTGAAGYRGDGGPAVAAKLDDPRAVAVDSSGNVYIADSRNFRIRRIDRSGTITTVAGPGESRAAVEGPHPSIHRGPFGMPESVAVDSSGNVYVLVGLPRAVLRIDPSGTTTVLAQGGIVPAGLWYAAQGLAVDSAGSVYVADPYNGRVHRIDQSGAITTVAGLPIG